jgi:hypothetical protein
MRKSCGLFSFVDSTTQGWLCDPAYRIIAFGEAEWVGDVSGRIYLPYEEVKPGSKPPDPGNLPEFTPGTFRLMIVATQM